MADSAVPFKVQFKQEDIQDLKRRLELARWPDELEDAEPWQYGTDKAFLKDLAEYWRTKFSFKDTEALLNQYKQYKLPLNGVDVHFLHEKSENPDAIPLLFVHGWPGSFFEVYKLLPLLKAGKGAGAPDFHIVAPSLPGFGFSSAPKKKGFGVEEMAKTFNELMLKLGYSNYVAQGGDWGAIIVKALGTYYASNCRAIHSNMAISIPSLSNPWHVAVLLNASMPGLKSFPLLLSAKEVKYMQDTTDFQAEETGYSKEQGTKPQTLGYGMTDSPVGLLAWIVEKFHRWTDNNGDLTSVISKDELLTNISIYWFSRNITSSFRIYYEFIHTDLKSTTGTFMPSVANTVMSSYCKAPTAIAIFPKELYKPVRTFMKSSYNVKQVSEFERGGHFAAMEVPDLLAKDMQTFFAKWH